tara:strand:+ start:1656 stop:2141 length:486 start_codon:yes stop_codon:yes gene_type:complete
MNHFNTPEKYHNDHQVVWCNSETDILKCHRLMVQLVGPMTGAEFTHRVSEQMKEGYQLVSLYSGDLLATVAGFKIIRTLSWGKILFLDDLVTDAPVRGMGYGTAMLRWIKEYAQKNGCHQLHLDSGINRKDAHRFYSRQDLEITCYHYSSPLKDGQIPLIP